MPTLYALLVGIDSYPHPVSPLHGCVNDVTAFQDLVGERQSDPWQFEARVLLNHEATREGIISGFREHLRKAGPDDVAWFYFSGHGSREPAPSMFWHLEPDREFETFVCYDSRLPGGYDLADKELSKLLHEVALRAGHVLVILDRCFAGSGTRDGQVVPLNSHSLVRSVPPRSDPRPLNSYLFTADDLAMLPSTDAVSPAVPPGAARRLSPSASSSVPRWFQTPHVLLAASQADQVSWEKNFHGKQHGVFSYHLMEVLRDQTNALTYREWMQFATHQVQKSTPTQFPHGEVFDGATLDAISFRGTPHVAARHYTVAFHAASQVWRLDAGAVHGIENPQSERTTHLLLFPLNVSPEQLGNPMAAVGSAEVVKVDANYSDVRLGSHLLDRSLVYQATVSLMVNARWPIEVVVASALGGEDQEAAESRAAYLRRSIDCSVHLRSAEVDEKVDWQLRVAPDSLALLRRDSAELQEPSFRWSKQEIGSDRQTVELLEHVARWHRILRVTPEPEHALAAETLEIEIEENGEWGTEGEVTLAMKSSSTGRQPAAIRVRVQHGYSQPLFVSCLLLCEDDFEAQLIPFAAETCQCLEPHRWVLLNAGTSIRFEVPDGLRSRGIDRAHDYFKFIFCEALFDPERLTQPAIDEVLRCLAGNTRSTVVVPRKDDVCIQAPSTRKGSVNQDQANVKAWGTRTLPITTRF